MIGYSPHCPLLDLIALGRLYIVCWFSLKKISEVTAMELIPGILVFRAVNLWRYSCLTAQRCCSATEKKYFRGYFQFIIVTI